MAASTPLPDCNMSYHFRPIGLASRAALPAEQVGEETHVVGVVGDHEKIERPGELHLLAAGCSQVGMLKGKMAFRDANTMYKGQDYRGAAAKYYRELAEEVLAHG